MIELLKSTAGLARKYDCHCEWIRFGHTAVKGRRATYWSVFSRISPDWNRRSEQSASQMMPLSPDPRAPCQSSVSTGATQRGSSLQ